MIKLVFRFNVFNFCDDDGRVSNSGGFFPLVNGFSLDYHNIRINIVSRGWYPKTNLCGKYFIGLSFDSIWEFTANIESDSVMVGNEKGAIIAPW